MKYIITISAITAVFAALGLLSAWGVVHYDKTGGRDLPFLAFTIMPVGGAVTGLLTACIAAALSEYLCRREVAKPSAA